jgi:N-acetylmuramic acid 6-phosphate etherase
VYGNLMIDVRATNAKLVKRALRLAMLASGAPEDAARAALGASGWRVKVAVVMLKGGFSVHQAEDRLEAAEGSVHGALSLDGTLPAGPQAVEAPSAPARR